MMFETVPEESSGCGLDDDDDSSKCSSLSDLNDDDDDVKPNNNKRPSILSYANAEDTHNASFSSRGTIGQAGDAQVSNGRNRVLASIVITAVVLTIATSVALAKTTAQGALPSIFALLIILAFVNVGYLFYVYDKQVQRRLSSHQAARKETAALTKQQQGTAAPPPVYYDMCNDGDSINKGATTTTTRTTTNVIQHSVNSLLKPFRGGGGKSSSQTFSSTGDGTTSDQHQLSHDHGMASTESLDKFLGAVQRQPSFLMGDNSARSSGSGAGTKPTTLSLHQQTKSVAEFFPETTVLFADVQGFTAWSSVREPSQVFTLLESLFHAFDGIAQRRNVFKVETVGDCYVAVTGIPQPRKDHAVIMCRFAHDCLHKMGIVCRKLEKQLGPETGDLGLRIGLHSGAVTGGVLRGKRSRFQLFGDTVNTAARIESTGMGNKIHLSETTAELVKRAGKSHWVTQREDKIEAKGLGVLQTYFLQVQSTENDVEIDLRSDDDDEDDSQVQEDMNATMNTESPDNSSSNGTAAATHNAASSISASKALGTQTSSAKVERLVDWNVDLLARLLKHVVARRLVLVASDPQRKEDADESVFMTRAGTLLEEVKETIELPHDRTMVAEQAKYVELEPAVHEQLKDYVRSVANMYPNHGFHNFEHASHVTMSVAKLLSRIVAPSAHEFNASSEAEGNTLHDHTYGITSDPLTQFTCVLSALIHDADHPGVPNSQLVEEKTVEAELYKGKSVAESNSVDKCWSLLMETRYSDLRKTIYTTAEGLARFRSLLVNSVMATDICDPDLKGLRNGRWDRAFDKDGKSPEQSAKAANDRKATIVIEHLIQASDVSHTMQHWHVYRKWNERLFRECYKAYREGRAQDPSTSWYEGEKGFFDFYIIPLAKKLKECGVFGVSSSEYLDYALNNRREWELRGQDVVRDMVANVIMIERQMGNQQAQD
ncbi:Receptor-type guanylate cyclase gcy [Seminavis robusta]|uniref:Receptor-type guanylate cyclase gcy n=1 Tax=Seminavis robusta TaxID=568900 RepID=A0A9N8H508_9STRA|nr:Receptor-type guanylate cyclase gcy [Seminavis robusta]|eukprot:Sro16_g011690.1 Receptor-type guanylate cyclase gcy (942) ;mRNA; r:69094-73921